MRASTLYVYVRGGVAGYLHARRSISPRVQIVSYAREKYFSACANSQLRQTRYYVIDEGSCDESR